MTHEEGFIVHDASTEWALATSGRLLVNVWRGAVTTERVALVDRAIRQLLNTYETYGSITLVEPTLSMASMSDQARADATALQARWAQRMVCSAYLVVGEGFLPATVRTLTAGMQLVTRSPHPIRTFGDPVVAAEWVAPFVGMDADSVLRTLTRTRTTE
jgi:hypothetical protein